MKPIFVFVLAIFIIPTVSAFAEFPTITDLNNTDSIFNTLYESTVASKNRLLRHERKDEYTAPVIYRYTLKRGEDIWTIIAKTSLNVDTISTLNRIDFIGMIHEDSTVYLPDTLGLFFEEGEVGIPEIAQKYSIPETDIQKVTDPLHPTESLLFAPEVTLSFLERTYLTGVVFYAPLMGVETSRFGPRIDPFVNERTFHGGVDIAAEEGKNVYSARWGKVVYAGEINGYGNTVILEHELGYYTLYGHLEKILVEKGEKVDSGQIIGTVGTTGKTTGPHLHFEIRRENQKLNPDNIPNFIFHKQTGQ
jgi:murein DD-endopeptidase MepM/ murein hydrolase activator NlpD